jgi:hypothetical protein
MNSRGGPGAPCAGPLAFILRNTRRAPEGPPGVRLRPPGGLLGLPRSHPMVDVLADRRRRAVSTARDGRIFQD